MGHLIDFFQKTLFGEIDTDDAILNTVLVCQFTSDFFKQGKTAGSQDEIDAACCQLPFEFPANAGRSPCDNCPGSELILIDAFHLLCLPSTRSCQSPNFESERLFSPALLPPCHPSFWV